MRSNADALLRCTAAARIISVHVKLAPNWKQRRLKAQSDTPSNGESMAPFNIWDITVMLPVEDQCYKGVHVVHTITSLIHTTVACFVFVVNSEYRGS